MKRLIPDTFMGYELISYEYYINGKRQIISYAYEIGKSRIKEDFEFQAISNKKQNALRILKKEIINKKNIVNYNANQIKTILIKNHNDLIYHKNGKLFIYHKDSFIWLKNHIKSEYNYKIKLEGDEIKC